MTQAAADPGQDSAVQDTLAYATPVAPPSMGAAGVLAFVGLGLIALGGCFLIGILIFQAPQSFTPGIVPAPLTFGNLLFISILYIMAAICFASAGWLLVRVAVRLFKLI